MHERRQPENGKQTMNTTHGWIKLYRCLLDDPIWQCGTNEQKIILVTLLLMANHAEAKWQWNGRPYHCQPGQMVTSLNSIREKCGKRISIKNIRTALLRFEKMGFLANQSATHNRLITICNWEHYQSQVMPDGKATGNQSANDGQTPGKRLAPNKNNKECKNEKNLSGERGVSFKDDFSNDPLLQETLRKAKEYDDEQNRICEMLQRTNP
jgi:DNA replication protein DnaD